MTGKELVRRVVRHQDHPRIAWHFSDPCYRDIQTVSTISLVNEEAQPYLAFSDYPQLRKRIDFRGELSMDKYGNIIGRLNGKTKGECVLGALEEGLECIEQYSFPQVDEAQLARVKALDLPQSDKYVLSYMPFGVFSTLRDLRKMDNALMDIAADPELVEAYLKRFTQYATHLVSLTADCGADGIILCDDWGMQYSPFISPRSFRTLFAPVYKAIADICHERDMDFMLHSCGFVLPLVDDMIEAGIDVLQFDQIEAAGSTMWAEKYSDRVAFYSPVDIQRVLPTGDRALIEESALHLVTAFKEHGGALIAKDYPTYGDIGVEEEWASWARKIMIEHSFL